MWTCPKCERQFKTTNQSHTCSKVSIDALFEGRPDELVLAFDRLLALVVDWEPISIGTAKHTIVLTNRKAWLIVKPMRQELDLKFYYPEALESELFRRVARAYNHKFAHHLRIRHPEEINEEMLALLRKGYDFALG